MHFVMTYDLGAEGARREEIEERILTIIKPYQFVKRLTTFYIIHINSSAEWDTIRRQLSDLSKSIPERLHFIMSPLMDGGRYNGILPQGQWDDINSLTNLD